MGMALRAGAADLCACQLSHRLAEKDVLWLLGTFILCLEKPPDYCI